MKAIRRIHTLLACCCAMFGTAHAQTWPTKPLKLIVPYAAGGSTDQLARAVADPLGRALGQAVLVENKPGGNTIIGADAVAKSAPDGYTLFMGSSGSLAVNPLLYARLPYDAKNDFAGVTMLAASPLVMVVHPDLPAKSVKEFIALAKAQPFHMLISPARVCRSAPLHTPAMPTACRVRWASSSSSWQAARHDEIAP